MSDEGKQSSTDRVSCDEEKVVATTHIDLVNNIQARIQNPLHGIPQNILLKQVELFTKEKGLEDKTELFKKGALLAQNPRDFEDISELSEEDKEIIRRETTHRWSQSRELYMTIVICSLAAAVQGWDQTGSNGANLSFPQEFGITSEPGNPRANVNDWIVGVINSGPYIASCLVGCWLTDPLNHFFGRRGTLFWCGIFCTLSVIGQGLAQTWEQLFVCRLLLGLGMGPKAATSPVFAAENVPANIRGGLVMSWQMWTAFGIFLGFSANLALQGTGSIAWRLELGSAFLPAIPLTVGIYFCPGTSPRWYMKKNRYLDAYKSFCRLRNSELQAAQMAILKGTNYVSRFFELFSVPRIPGCHDAQQMCGINIIAFYSSTIFVKAGYTSKQALLASWGFGLVNWVFAFPAVWTIDTFGRRNLLLFTFPNMAWTLLAAGFCFYIPESAVRECPLLLSSSFYSPGEGPVFPLTHREMGMSWAVATCFFWAARCGSVGAFGFYAGLNVVAFLMIFLFMPETKQRTLEELDYVFAVPTSKHVSYQVKEFLPYGFVDIYFYGKCS
ncbi:sugar transporter [Flammula alnicola]|nr:sugar transporter [Flammula alnicola]